MKKIQQQVQAMYQQHPRSLVLGMIIKQPQTGKFYIQSANIDRLKAALIEEGRIPINDVTQFIESLKSKPVTEIKSKGNQLF